MTLEPTTKHKSAIKRAIGVLNQALRADREAMSALMMTYVRTNRTLGEHSTIQVNATKKPDGTFTDHYLSPLGLINGLFGIDERGLGHIRAIVEDESRLILYFEENADPVGGIKDKGKDA